MFEGKIRLKKRSGAASFVVTAVLTIVVIGVITSLSIITSRQVRQATDLDQSSRAINAAQSGVEAYAALVGNDENFEHPDCKSEDPDEVINPEPQINDSRAANKQDIALVCSRVKRSGDTFRGYLQRDQAITFKLNSAERPDGINGGVSQMSFYWNLYNSDSLNFEESNFDANPINYPVLADPSASRNEPATLEFTFSWCPKNTPTDPEECDYNRNNFLNSTTNKNKGIPTRTVVIRPWASSDGFTSGCDGLSNQIGDYRCHIPATITETNPSGHPGICTPGPGCLLPQDLTNSLNDLPLMTGGANKVWDAAILENYNLTVTVRARYASTHFAVKFSGIGDGNGEARSWDFPQTMIEVIARSGDVYRSVSGNKTTQYSINDMLAYAVFSGKNICKNMMAYDDVTIKPQNTCLEP